MPCADVHGPQTRKGQYQTGREMKAHRSPVLLEAAGIGGQAGLQATPASASAERAQALGDVPCSDVGTAGVTVDK